MTDLSAEYQALANYRPTHKVRFVTAASLFDGHDAAINIMRRILQGMGAGATALAFPHLARAQAAEVKVGFLLPLTGSFAESGQLIKMAVEMAIEEINASGGIKSMKGAKMVGVFGNSTSVDEANVLVTFQFWKDVVTEVHAQYPDVAL